MIFDPAKVIVQSYGGATNMGSLDYRHAGDTNDAARFALAGRYVLVFIRIHFLGSGSGLADLAINIDSHRGREYDVAMFTLKNRGMGADVNFRIPEGEAAHWLFDGGDVIVLTWTNPDDGNINWGAEVGLMPIETDATL